MSTQYDPFALPQEPTPGTGPADATSPASQSSAEPVFQQPSFPAAAPQEVAQSAYGAQNPYTAGYGQNPYQQTYAPAAPQATENPYANQQPYATPAGYATPGPYAQQGYAPVAYGGAEPEQSLASMSWWLPIVIGLIGPVIGLATAKTPFAQAHARQSMNFQLTMVIAMVVLGTVTFGLAMIPLGIWNLVVCIQQAMAANRGESARKPSMTIEFLK